MTAEVVIALLAAAVQSGTPILYATLGEIFTEKSGVLNLGVEGAMILGALTGFMVARHTGNPALGFFAAGLIGSLAAAVHGVVCLWFQGNQVVSGLALTILGTGLANYLGTAYYRHGGTGLRSAGCARFVGHSLAWANFFPARSPGLSELSPAAGDVAVFYPDPVWPGAAGGG